VVLFLTWREQKSSERIAGKKGFGMMQQYSRLENGELRTDFVFLRIIWNHSERIVRSGM